MNVLAILRGLIHAVLLNNHYDWPIVAAMKDNSRKHTEVSETLSSTRTMPEESEAESPGNTLAVRPELVEVPVQKLKTRGIVSTSSFEELVNSGQSFVDKSVFICEVMRRRETCICISRPPLTGKSVNVDMLGQFLDIKGCINCFNNLNIMNEEHKRIRLKHHRKYPVIRFDFISMTPIMNLDKESVFVAEVRRGYLPFLYLIDAGNVTIGKTMLKEIKENTASPNEILTSIPTLCQMLQQYHGVRPIIIADETDTIIAIKLNQTDFEEVKWALYKFLMASLKDNIFLYKAIFIGVLPLFTFRPYTGVSNVQSFTVLDEGFKSSFGFTQNEVSTLMTKFHVSSITIDEMAQWYNHFSVGSQPIFSVVSVLSCIELESLQCYRKLFTESVAVLLSMLLENMGLLPLLYLQVLIKGGTMNRTVSYHFEFDTIFKDESSMWSLLLHAGMISIHDRPNKGETISVVLIEIPGKELQVVIDTEIIKAKVRADILPDYDELTKRIKSQDIEYIRTAVTKYIHDSGSYLYSPAPYLEDTTVMSNFAEYIVLIFDYYNRLYDMDIDTPAVTADHMEVTVWLENKRTGIISHFFRKAVIVKLVRYDWEQLKSIDTNQKLTLMDWMATANGLLQSFVNLKTISVK